MTVRACPPLVKPVWRTGTEGLFTVFLSARPVRGERSHEPRARASDRAPETIDRALVVDASNATMAGDGFVPNRGALDAAADAANPWVVGRALGGVADEARAHGRRVGDQIRGIRRGRR